MHTRILLTLLIGMLGFASALPAQNSHFLIKTNVLTLPQRQLAMELELQPVGSWGIILGGSTLDDFVDLGSLAWFRRGSGECKVETYSLMAGLAYFHPLKARLEAGGKVLYQYRRTFIYDEYCIYQSHNMSNVTFVYGINSHYLHLLPSIRYFPTKHFFLEAAYGIGIGRSVWNTGGDSRWFPAFPAQLSVGLKF